MVLMALVRLISPSYLAIKSSQSLILFFKDKQSCAVCKHKLMSHGNMQNLKLEDAEKIVCLVLQMEQLLQEATRSPDPLKREKSAERAGQLKH